MALTVKVFNFDDPESWKKVQAVVNDPLPVRALTAGMKVRCQELGKQWTPELGPWQLGEKTNKVEFVARDGPNWYRINGQCHVIAPWCAAIGSLLYPDHQWLVWYNYFYQELNGHSAGLGFLDGEQKSVVIMDILRGHQALRRGSARGLMKRLTASTAFSLPIDAAIKQLEARCRNGGGAAP